MLCFFQGVKSIQEEICLVFAYAEYLVNISLNLTTHTRLNINIQYYSSFHACIFTSGLGRCSQETSLSSHPKDFRIFLSKEIYNFMCFRFMKRNGLWTKKNKALLWNWTLLLVYQLWGFIKALTCIANSQKNSTFIFKIDQFSLAEISCKK